MGKLELLRQGVGMIGSFGVGVIIKNVIASSTPEKTGKIVKATITVGSIILAAIGCSLIEKQVDTSFDNAEKWFSDIMHPEEDEKE